jgi:hypothetical protein
VLGAHVALKAGGDADTQRPVRGKPKRDSYTEKRQHGKQQFDKEQEQWSAGFAHE